MSSVDLTSAEAPTVVELHNAIETPENVVLTYRMAGPALRFWAYLIDFIIRVAVLFVALFAVMVGEVAISGVPTGLWLLLWFFMEWGYFAVLEGFCRGKTIGKHALNLRVIQEAGHPISFWSAVLRNFLRAADALPLYGMGLLAIPLYGAGFVSMTAAGRFRRLGDLVAGTVVIEERSVLLPREPIIFEKIQPLPRTEINSYVPPHRTLALIEEFLQRRFVLTHQRGHELASRLASVLAKKLDFQGETNFVDEYPMAFLARVYVTFHRTMGDDDEHAQEIPHADEVAIAVDA